MFGVMNAICKKWDLFSRDTPSSICRLAEEEITKAARICAQRGQEAVWINCTPESLLLYPFF